MFNPAELAVVADATAGRAIAGRPGCSAVVLPGRLVRVDVAEPDVRHHRHRSGGHHAHRQGAQALMDVDPALPGTDRAEQQRPAAVRGLPLGQPAFLQGRRRRASTCSSPTSRRPVSRCGPRSTLTLTQFQESDAFGPQNPTSGTPNHTGSIGCSQVRPSTGFPPSTTAIRPGGGRSPRPMASPTRWPCATARRRACPA